MSENIDSTDTKSAKSKAHEYKDLFEYDFDAEDDLTNWEDWAYLDKPIKVFHHSKGINKLIFSMLKVFGFLFLIMILVIILNFYFDLYHPECLLSIIYIPAVIVEVFILLAGTQEPVKLYKKGLIVRGDCIDFYSVKKIWIIKKYDLEILVGILLKNGHKLDFTLDDKKDFTRIVRTLKRRLAVKDL